jgi:formamidopyrimidine-DNA glycosylase
MPELPEVETLRRLLGDTLVGRRIVALDVRSTITIGQSGVSASSPAPSGTLPWSVDLIVGARVQGVRRRAKFLIVDLDNGTSLVVHLRLAGQFAQWWPDGRFVAGGHPEPPFGAPMPHKSTRLVFHLDDGSSLYLTDIRGFARVLLTPTARVAEFLDGLGLGVEPLSPEFTVEHLAERLRQHDGQPLKPLLLDQHFVAGLGNIYVDEALFLAGLHPLRRAGSLTSEEVRRLHQAIRDALGRALDGLPTVVRGKAMTSEFPRVHGRAGAPCPRCAATIVKVRVGGRGTYLCPRCQALPAAASGSDGVHR